MKKIYKSIMLIAGIIAGFGSLASCSDDDLPTADRLFRPILGDVVTGLDSNTQPYMSLKWDQYADANQYVVKVVSTDGTDSASITTDSTAVTFSNLKYDQEYNVYIHSVNTVTGLSSRDYNKVVTTQDFPTLLSSFTSDNIIDTQARVIWTKESSEGTTTYDSLLVYQIKGDSLVSNNKITEADVANGSKIVKGMKPKTQYRVEAYKDGQYKGKKLFTTVASESYEGATEDLRSLTEDESKTKIRDAYLDSIIALYPDQNVTFILQGGVTYNINTVNLPSTTGNITFVTGLTLSGNAIFDVTGNFNLTADVSIDTLTFDKINFYGAQPDASDANMGGKYLFNINSSGAAIGTLSITNSNIKWKRGVVRLRGGASIENYNIDNCVIDSIGGYGISNVDASGTSINNIKVTNSTMSNCSVTFCNTKGNNMNSVVIENCTFCYCNTNGKNMFDFKGKTITEGIKMNNCIIGVSGATSGNLDANGLAGYSGVAPETSDCYFTSDLIWQPVSEEDPSPVSQITGTTLSTSTAETFEAPLDGNFKLKAGATGDAKPGDPRWY